MFWGCCRSEELRSFQRKQGLDLQSWVSRFLRLLRVWWSDGPLHTLMADQMADAVRLAAHRWPLNTETGCACRLAVASVLQFRKAVAMAL